MAKNLEEPSPSLKVCTDNSTYSFIVCDGIALDITQSGVSAFIALVAVCFGFQFSYPVIYDQLQGFIQEVALKLGHSQDYSRLGKFLEYAEYF